MKKTGKDRKRGIDTFLSSNQPRKGRISYYLLFRRAKGKRKKETAKGMPDLV